jgi:iron complex transport system permease protein
MTVRQRDRRLSFAAGRHSSAPMAATPSPGGTDEPRPVILPVRQPTRRGRARRRARLPLAAVLIGCVVLLVVTMTLGVAIGSVGLSPGSVWQVVVDHLSGHPKSSTVPDEIVWQIRLPRVLLAAVVGAALTTAGTVVQALVRNALADPFLLGVSSGASVGATAVLLFGAFASFGVWALSIGSVLGALAAMATVFLVSRTGQQLAATQLILCGVVLSALFESVTSFLIFRGNPQATQSILFWLLGSFGNANWTQLPIPAICLVVAMGYLLAQGRSLNALAMGSEPAASLGVDVDQLRRNLFIVCSLMVGVAVAVSGVIGFVGLVVPHIVRLMVGSEHRRVLPVGLLFGASFMVVGDLLARTIVAPQEMPIGVITAFIGAPTLIVLIRRRPYLYGASQ